MNSRHSLRPFISSSIAVGLLVTLCFTTYSLKPELENKLFSITREASLLNLKINQSILFHKFGLEKNYDHLAELVSSLENIKYQFRYLKPDIATFNNDTINKTLLTFDQQVALKIQLVEDFKSHHAVYKNSHYFFQTLIQKIYATPQLNPSIEATVHQIQQELLSGSDKVSSKSISLHIASLKKQLFLAESQVQNQLDGLILHAQVLALYGNESFELIENITAQQFTLAIDGVEKVISEHYLLEHKKARASQNILFLFAVFGISYIAFLLFSASKQSKKLNLTLLEKENQLFALNQHAVVSATDIKGNIKYVNGKFCDISGFNKLELIGKTHSIVNSGFHNTLFFKNMWKIIASGNVWHGEIKNKTKTGEFYWVNASIVPIFDHSETISEYIAIRTDITLQKHFEEQLIEKQYFMDQLTATMAQGVYSMDTNGLCTFWNNEAERILGWNQQDLMGKGIHNIIHFQDAEGNHVSKENCPTQKSILKNTTFNSETDVFTHKDGSIIPISITAVPLIENGLVIGSVAVFSDISLRLATERQLNIAIEDAEQANKAKSEFLANMSHEIRTPMNGIIGMTELALDTQLDREQKEYLEIVKNSSHALLTIINDILDFSKIEAGKLELEKIEFNLHDLLKETTKTLSIRAYQQGLEMILDISPVVPSILVGDPGRLRQVLTNLLGNAIKFTKQGEIKLTVSLYMGGDEKSCLQFDVSDTGIGISEQRQEGIFESFSQEDSSVSRKYGGTGLGLSISRQLIHLMGGEIWLKSQQDMGSTFSFSAWFEHQNDTDINEAIASLQNVPVLLVDDNESNRQILNDLFSQWGMIIVSVTTAEQVLAELTQPQYNYELLLVDSILNNTSGFELIKTIQSRQLYNKAIVMLLSSGMDKEEIQQCQTMDLSGYIVKPMSHSDILDELHSVFNASLISTHINPPKTEQIKNESLNILVAEDNLINQQLAKTLLTKHGHHVSIANNGLEAIELFKNKSYDLILMDFQMPEMDGLEATQQIRLLESKTLQHIPIIAMTANAMKEDKDMALSAGMDDFLSKPINASTLFDTIKKHIEKQTSNNVTINTSVTSKTCDWETALSHLDGDSELLEILAAMFVKDYEQYIKKIKAELNNKNWSALALELHSLKGVCATVAADKSVQLIKQAETILSNQKISEVEAVIILIEQEILLLIQDLITRLPEQI